MNGLFERILIPFSVVVAVALMSTILFNAALGLSEPRKNSATSFACLDMKGKMAIQVPVANAVADGASIRFTQEGDNNTLLFSVPPGWVCQIVKEDS